MIIGHNRRRNVFLMALKEYFVIYDNKLICFFRSYFLLFILYENIYIPYGDRVEIDQVAYCALF